MSDDTGDDLWQQADMLETQGARSLLDELLADSRLYRKGKDYQDLLNFVVRLRDFAPFNAMLLQVQKPGLSYAASAHDWQERFGRKPKEAARPLLILWPFGPVALVYDVLDTEGKPLPEDVASFVSYGAMKKDQLRTFQARLQRNNIDWLEVDAGDNLAGLIRAVGRASNDKKAARFRIHINRNHETAVQFMTLAHELGHLFLGHLGADKALRVPQRLVSEHAQRELEAESVAFIVCERQGIESKSHRYLSSFVSTDTTLEHMDVYQILRAAGQVETILGLASRTKFDQRVRRR
jgi:hypothetical protein